MHGVQKRDARRAERRRLLTAAFGLCAALLPLQARAEELSVDDVIALHEASLGDDLILAKLGQEGRTFDLSVEQMLALKEAGVSTAVIQRMLGAGAESAPGAAASTSASSDGYPEEIGVYLRRDGKWEFLEPEIVTWRSGGMLKSLATAGLHKGHISGVIQNRNSRVQVSAPIEVFLRCGDGTSATEYQLLNTEVRKDLREFRALTAGALRVRSGSERNSVAFEPKRVAPRGYLVRLERLEAGEYGFLPPGMAASESMSSSGKIFAFGVE